MFFSTHPYIRKGRYPPPPGEPDTLGLEMAGVVEEVTTTFTCNLP
jgi:hypothetical protein